MSKLLEENFSVLPKQSNKIYYKAVIIKLAGISIRLDNQNESSLIKKKKPYIQQFDIKQRKYHKIMKNKAVRI